MALGEDQLPNVWQSHEVVGTIKEDIAEELGLRKDVKLWQVPGTMLPRLELELLAMVNAIFPWYFWYHLYPVRVLE